MKIYARNKHGGCQLTKYRSLSLVFQWQNTYIHTARCRQCPFLAVLPHFSGASAGYDATYVSRNLFYLLYGANKSRKPYGLFLKNIKFPRKTLVHFRVPIARWSVEDCISTFTKYLLFTPLNNAPNGMTQQWNNLC